MLLLLITFAGLVAVLRHYQDQPLPDWPLGFSISTALSVFGLVFRGLLLFISSEGIGQLKWSWLARRRPLGDLAVYDQASRGAWGSVKLLWTARWRHVTAMLGASITVVALGVDPFTQAVVGYYGCSVQVSNATSSVSRINLLFPLAMPTESNTDEVAIDSSLGNGRALLPDYTCSVGNCTFSQPYHTIGLCSTCTNMTDKLVKECNGNSTGIPYGAGCTYSLRYQNSSTATAGYQLTEADGDNSDYNWNFLNMTGFSDA